MAELDPKQSQGFLDIMGRLASDAGVNLVKSTLLPGDLFDVATGKMRAIPSPAPGPVVAPGPALPVIPSPVALPGDPGTVQVPPGIAAGTAPAKPVAASGPGVPGTKDLEREAVANRAAGERAVNDLALVQEQGGIDAKAARDDAAAKSEQHLTKLAAETAIANQVSERLRVEQAQAIETAKTKTIPDFWGSNYGKMTGAAIATGLSGIGAGLLGSTENTALSVIQHNVDTYFEREKQKIDNMFKFAQEKGKLDDKIINDWQMRIVNLKEQHGLVMEAAKQRAEGVMAESKGAADAAQTKIILAQLGDTAIKQQLDARKLRSDMVQSQAQAEAAKASARNLDADTDIKKAMLLDPNLGKPVSAEAGKARGYADTAEAADKILQGTMMSEAGANAVRQTLANDEIYKSIPLGLGAAARSAAIGLKLDQVLGQKLNQADRTAWIAMRQFVNADLRRESGSAIGIDEFDSARERYFRGPGDSEQDLAQKAQNRRDSIHSARVQGGQEASTYGRPQIDPAQQSLLQTLQANPQNTLWMGNRR